MEELILEQVLIFSVWFAVVTFCARDLKTQSQASDQVCFGIKAAGKVTDIPLRFGDFFG